MPAPGADGSTISSNSGWSRDATATTATAPWATGRRLMWARIPEVIEGIDATTLAILGDFVPMGVGMALGIQGGGNSLDNTLRVVRLVPTEWVLLDIRIHGVERGFGHGWCTCSPRTAR